MQHRLVYDGPCRDNATLACEVEHKGAQFPMVLTTKRVSPGDMNTCMPAPVCLPVGSPVRVHPHRRHVVQRRVHHQEPSPDPHAALHSRWRTGAPIPRLPRSHSQAWHVTDIGFATAYSTITGGAPPSAPSRCSRSGRHLRVRLPRRNPADVGRFLRRVRFPAAPPPALSCLSQACQRQGEDDAVLRLRHAGGDRT